MSMASTTQHACHSTPQRPSMRLITCLALSLLFTPLTSVITPVMHDAQAQSTESAPTEAHGTLKERVTLSVEAYRALLNATGGQRDRASWSQASLTLDLSEARGAGWAWVEVEAQLTGSSEAWASLAPLTASPLQAWLDGQALTPQSASGHYEAPLKGRRQLKLRYPARFERRNDGSQVALIPTPMTPSATLRLQGAPSGAELVPALPKSGAQLALSGAIAVTLPPQESGHLLQRQDVTLTLHSSGDGLELRSQSEVLLRGPKAWVPLAPSSEALLSAQLDGKEAIIQTRGAWLSAWVEGEGTHTLTSHVRLPVDRSKGQPSASLSLLKAPRGHLSLSLPGQREVSLSPSLPMTTRTVERPKEGTPNEEPQEPNMTQVELDLPPLERLSLSWTERREAPEESAPQFLADTYQLFSLQEGLLKGEAQLELEVMKGELERLLVRVPDGVVLYQVTGEGVEGWVTLPPQESATEGSERLPRRVAVDFGTPARGKVALNLKWQRVVTLKERFELPLIAPLGAFQQSGVIALYDGERVGFTPAETNGTLTATGQEALPQRVSQLKAGEKVTQAFRHVQAPGQVFTSSTSERTQEVRFDAQLESLFTAREGSIRAQTQALISLKSGRLERLVIALPKACSEPQVSGPSLNRVEALPDEEQTSEGLTRYSVSFTRRLEGALTLNVDTELLVAGEASEVSLPQLTIEGAELSRGALGVGAEVGLELTPREGDTGAEALRKASVDELPRSVRLRAHVELLYGYRFTRPWALSVGLKRHEVIETLTARVLNASWESRLLKSGQVVHEMSYHLENQERRVARFTLPKGARVRSVTVNDQPVRAQDEGGVISVPIPKHAESDLKLSYELRLEDPREVSLTAPSSDLHTSNVTWEVSYDSRLRPWPELSKGLYVIGTLNRWVEESVHQSTFAYDLLEPNAPALTLKISFSEMVSRDLLNGLGWLIALSLFALGLLRPLIQRARLKLLSLILFALWVLFITLELRNGSLSERLSSLMESTMFMLLLMLFGALLSWAGASVKAYYRTRERSKVSSEERAPRERINFKDQRPPQPADEAEQDTPSDEEEV